MEKHRDKKLDSLIGKYVTILFKDNTIIDGILGFTEEFSAKYQYSKPYYYTCENPFKKVCFRKSHIKKIMECKN